nr:hypothetical protein [Helicobacter sp. NHP21005]
MKEKIYPHMLHATINNSIGNIKNHLTLEHLVSLFLNPPKILTLLEKYAIDVIQKEATRQEIDSFSQAFHIPQKEVEHILSLKIQW